MSSMSEPEFAGFFENSRAGRIAFPYCLSCQRFHWYPMPRCPHCRKAGWEWRVVSGPATVFSFTQVRHAFDKSRKDKLPYMVALVTFADAPGVRLITDLVSGSQSPRIGDTVEPVFPESGDGAPVTFRLTSTARSAP